MNKPSDSNFSARDIKTREDAERWVRASEPIRRRRALEEDLRDEYPEYEKFLVRRCNRFSELLEAMTPLDEANAIMKAEGFDDEKWEPERWRLENGETSPRRPPEDL